VRPTAPDDAARSLRLVGLRHASSGAPRRWHSRDRATLDAGLMARRRLARLLHVNAPVADNGYAGGGCTARPLHVLARDRGARKFRLVVEFIALIRKEPSRVFHVEFPDFPGCIALARTLERAQVRAAEALEFHIESMLDDGELIPSPSSIAHLMSDPDNLDALAIAVSI
jgi:predicted RNase H-like HicB family nuclease